MTHSLYEIRLQGIMVVVLIFIIYNHDSLQARLIEGIAQLKTIDLSTRLQEIKPTNSVVIPQSLLQWSIVLG